MVDTLKLSVYVFIFTFSPLLFIFYLIKFFFNKIVKMQLIPECSHHIAYFYLQPTVMNNILSMIKSLHSTLYTVWVHVSYWTKLKMMFSSKASAVSQKLKNIFKEVHWSHDVFILRTNRNNVMRKMVSVPTVVKEMCRDIQLTFWQQSINSSMVTTPSLFLSIFCWRRRQGKMKSGPYTVTDIYSAVSAANDTLAWKNTSTCWRGVSSLRTGYVHFPIMS